MHVRTLVEGLVPGRKLLPEEHLHVSIVAARGDTALRCE
jgi:hypothetical protein